MNTQFDYPHIITFHRTPGANLDAVQRAADRLAGDQRFPLSSNIYRSCGSTTTFGAEAHIPGLPPNAPEEQKAIELDSNHHVDHGHRADAHTLLPTPDWQAALADMDQSIPLHPQHNSEAYRFRAWIHENLGNHAAAERDRQSAQQHP